MHEEIFSAFEVRLSADVLRAALHELQLIRGSIGVANLDSRTALRLDARRRPLLAILDKLDTAATLLDELYSPTLRSFAFPASVSGLARQLTGLSITALPQRERARYTEEWAAELAELAERPRRAQLLYAFRLFGQALRLRKLPAAEPALERTP